MTTEAAGGAGARMRLGRRERVAAAEGWALAGPRTLCHTDALGTSHSNLPHCCTCPAHYRRNAQGKAAAGEGEGAEGEEGGNLVGRSGPSCSWVGGGQACLGNVGASNREEEGDNLLVPHSEADSWKSAHGCVFH